MVNLKFLSYRKSVVHLAKLQSPYLETKSFQTRIHSCLNEIIIKCCCCFLFCFVLLFLFVVVVVVVFLSDDT